METAIPGILFPATAVGRVTESNESARDAELRELFGDLADGRVEALERVWELTADDLYGLALWRTGSGADAEDVVQEVFVRIARAAKRLGRVKKPFGYLLRTAHRASIDVLRRRRRHAAEGEETLATLFVESDPVRAADASRLSRVLTELAPAQREVVYLKHFAGLKLREIGAATGVPTFTAASRYRLAVERLKKLLGVEP